MNRLCCLIVMLIACGICSGQKYGNIWHFGNNIGIDFNSCNPILISGSNVGFEGCATISDSTGQLLFYTNSDSVWNKLHVAMHNGYLFNSGGTLSQVMIIPKPLSSNLYYIITTKIQAAGSLSLRYHVVDVSLSGGLGDVVSKNNMLSTLNVTEQICATYHNNGTDIWLLTHEYGTNKFMAYLVTMTGISLTPIISNVGPLHVACISSYNARGEIKFSPDGSKLAFNGNGVAGNDPSNILTLFDFNNNTGQVSNPINLPFSRGEFGLSFSPDNSKLYGTTWKAFGFPLNDYNYLYQFDISSGVPSTIINSKHIIDSLQMPDSFGTLKIAPDGKVYVRYEDASYIGVINSPDSLGMACNYVKNGFYIGFQPLQFGLNNYIEYIQYCNSTGISILTNTTHTINIFPNPFSDKLNIITKTNEQLEVSLYDITSRKLFNQSFTISTSLNTSQLAKGIYIYEVRNKNGLIKKGNVVKD